MSVVDGLRKKGAPLRKVQHWNELGEDWWAYEPDPDWPLLLDVVKAAEKAQEYEQVYSSHDDGDGPYTCSKCEEWADRMLALENSLAALESAQGADKPETKASVTHMIYDPRSNNILDEGSLEEMQTALVYWPDCEILPLDPESPPPGAERQQ